MRQAYPNELYHFGIPGMKWGVRRYQNEDGSVTAAGARRYGIGLDINDKSRTNIAKIRLGESRRRLDAARLNKSTTRLQRSELIRREKLAKRAVKEGRKIDRGARLVSKGQTAGKNLAKSGIAIGAAYLGTRAMEKHMNMRIADLALNKKLTSGHTRLASTLVAVGGYSLMGAAGLYTAKKARDTSAINAYKLQAPSNHLGSSEYQAVLARKKKH